VTFISVSTSTFSWSRRRDALKVETTRSQADSSSSMGESTGRFTSEHGVVDLDISKVIGVYLIWVII
tara:strand:+ start:775 stop:975 length:201 start_codon:yes stop_codon:yes gene_type:complete